MESNESGFMTEVKTEKEKDIEIEKENKRVESEQYLNNLWNRLNEQNMKVYCVLYSQECSRLIDGVEQNMIGQIKQDEIRINHVNIQSNLRKWRMQN